MHTAACTLTQLTQLFLALRHNTVQCRLSFRHRACYRVIALLINVSLSQDNGLAFIVRFFRLAMRDIQWCNLLSVHYALCGSPWVTFFLGSSQVAHLLMHYFSFLPICFFSLLLRVTWTTDDPVLVENVIFAQFFSSSNLVHAEFWCHDSALKDIKWQETQTWDYTATAKYERNYSTDMFELSPAALCSLVETHSSDTNLA